MHHQQRVDQAVASLRQHLAGRTPPRVAVVLGTGLGGFAAAVAADSQALRLAYQDIPGFPRSTVESHAGEMLFGRLEGRQVVCLSGRFHAYEGYDAGEVAILVRCLALLGVRTLILTNAAGALNPRYEAGGLMCIADHINFTGLTPLRGANVDAWGERFPDMTRVWTPELQALALEQARRLGIRLEHGVYVQVPGPQMETPAETRMLRQLGADAVGMSTVLEAIAAVHMGVRLLGISCLANKNLPDCMAPAPLAEVIAMANRAGADLGRLLTAIIGALPQDA